MDAAHQSTGQPYLPTRWEEAIIAERFLYPQCHPREARMLRAFGRFLFYRSLEYSGYVDRGESRVCADLRGAGRDLRLLHGFIHSLGSSFDVTEVQAQDRPFVLLAEALAPRLNDLAVEIEEALPPLDPAHVEPLSEPMTADRRTILTGMRKEWEHELQGRTKAQHEAEERTARAASELQLLDILLRRPDTAE